MRSNATMTLWASFQARVWHPQRQGQVDRLPFAAILNLAGYLVHHSAPSKYRLNFAERTT
jgi:hypothetical protein